MVPHNISHLYAMYACIYCIYLYKTHAWRIRQFTVGCTVAWICYDKFFFSLFIMQSVHFLRTIHLSLSIFSLSAWCVQSPNSHHTTTTTTISSVWFILKIAKPWKIIAKMEAQEEQNKKKKKERKIKQVKKKTFFAHIYTNEHIQKLFVTDVG